MLSNNVKKNGKRCSVPNDTSIAKRCRDAGLRVIEVAGWQTRGRPYDFRPRGSVNHHTAGGANGKTPSLNGVINGFAGSAPGPLANALQSREPDGNDIIYVVAAGVSNHAGRGGWRGLSGNSSVFGLEIEHVGTVPLPEGRQRIAARFHAAMAKGRWNADMVCQHREWNPANKIDAATRVDPGQFRTWVAEALKLPLPKPPPASGGGTEDMVVIGLQKDGVPGNQKPFGFIDPGARKVWSHWGFKITWDGGGVSTLHGDSPPLWIGIPGTAPLVGWDLLERIDNDKGARICVYGLNGAEYTGIAHS
jgi:hypothetical protein